MRPFYLAVAYLWWGCLSKSLCLVDGLIYFRSLLCFWATTSSMLFASFFHLESKNLLIPYFWATSMSLKELILASHMILYLNSFVYAFGLTSAVCRFFCITICSFFPVHFFTDFCQNGFHYIGNFFLMKLKSICCRLVLARTFKSRRNDTTPFFLATGSTCITSPKN